MTVFQIGEISENDQLSAMETTQLVANAEKVDFGIGLLRGDLVVEFNVNFSQICASVPLFQNSTFTSFRSGHNSKKTRLRGRIKKNKCSNSIQEENRLSLPRRSVKKRGSAEIESKKRGTQLCLRGG